MATNVSTTAEGPELPFNVSNPGGLNPDPNLDLEASHSTPNMPQVPHTTPKKSYQSIRSSVSMLDNMQKAVDAVMGQGEYEGKPISLRKTCIKFRIPRSTLSTYVKEAKTNGGAIRRGRTGLKIPANVEEELVLFIIKMGDLGFPVDCQTVLNAATELSIACGIEFKGSWGWFEKFRGRHRDRLSRHHVHTLKSVRDKALSMAVLENWFKLVDETLKKMAARNGKEVEANEIWSFDESGYTPLKNRQNGILRGAFKSTFRRIQPKQDVVSLMSCTAASGSQLPFLFAIRGEPWERTTLNQLGDISQSCHLTATGWASSSLFRHWCKLFIQHLDVRRRAAVGTSGASNSNGASPPWHLLVLDGHDGHLITPAILDYLTQNRVQLLCTPSFTSQLLHPNELSYGVIGKAFQKQVKALENYHTNVVVNKWHLPNIIRRAHLKGDSVSLIQNGFRQSGLWPFDPNWIKESRGRIVALFPDIMLPAENLLEQNPNANLNGGNNNNCKINGDGNANQTEGTEAYSASKEVETLVPLASAVSKAVASSTSSDNTTESVADEGPLNVNLTGDEVARMASAGSCKAVAMVELFPDKLLVPASAFKCLLHIEAEGNLNDAIVRLGLMSLALKHHPSICVLDSLALPKIVEKYSALMQSDASAGEPVSLSHREAFESWNQELEKLSQKVVGWASRSHCAILVPVHLPPNHWCFAAILPKGRKVLWCDSLQVGMTNMGEGSYSKVVGDALIHLAKGLDDLLTENNSNGDYTIDDNNNNKNNNNNNNNTESISRKWKIVAPLDMKLQKNKYDCGLFVLDFAKIVTDNFRLGVHKVAAKIKDSSLYRVFGSMRQDESLTVRRQLLNDLIRKHRYTIQSENDIVDEESMEVWTGNEPTRNVIVDRDAVHRVEQAAILAKDALAKIKVMEARLRLKLKEVEMCTNCGGGIIGDQLGKTFINNAFFVGALDSVQLEQVHSLTHLPDLSVEKLFEIDLLAKGRQKDDIQVIQGAAGSSSSSGVLSDARALDLAPETSAQVSARAIAGKPAKKRKTVADIYEEHAHAILKRRPELLSDIAGNHDDNSTLTVSQLKAYLSAEGVELRGERSKEQLVRMVMALGGNRENTNQQMAM